MIDRRRALSPAMRAACAIAIAGSLVACSSRRRAPPAGEAAPPPRTTIDAAVAAAIVAGCDGTARSLGPGLTVERHRIAGASPLPEVEPCLDVVRIDLRLHQLALVMASRDGAPRPIPRWVDERRAVAAVNAAMFGADHKSLGELHDATHVDRDHDNERYGGWLVFDPIDASDPPARMLGRDCVGDAGPDGRHRYRAAIQSYRFLDCEGRPIAWADPKHYSSAAFGVDRQGRLVLVHARAPFRMTDVATAAGELALTGLLYAEGGPEATLVAGAGADRMVRIGSYESGFWNDDSNHTAWDVPNVLLAVPRATATSP